MSVLDDTLKKHRRRIIEREERTFREMLAAYDLLEKDLRKQFRELQKKIKAAQDAGEDVSPSWFSREKRLVSLIDQVKIQIERFGGKAAPIIEREQRAAIGIAVSQARDVFNVILDAERPLQAGSLRSGVGSSLTPRVVENAVGAMGDGSPILEYFKKNLAPAVAEKLRSEIVKAAATGTDFRTIARRLMDAGKITRHRALSTARTEVNRIRRETTRQIYEENSDIIEAWEWVAVKSSRTCVLCLALDGRIFPLKKPFPQHTNCRCSIISVIKGVERPKRTLGSEWFEKQPDDVKEKILGKEAFLAYKDGLVELMDFVGFAHHKEFGQYVYRKPLTKVLADKALVGIGPTTGAVVSYVEDAKFELRKLLGRSLRDQEVATLVGALDEAEITVTHSKGRVFFNIEHEFINSQLRTIQRDGDGDLYLYNSEFFKREGAPQGVGAISFAREVSKAADLGIKYIKTHAIGDYETATRDFDKQSGYYVWGLFGYNAPLKSFERKLFQELLNTNRPIRDINDLMLADGEDEWFIHGSERVMIFKLDGRAKSMKVLRKYLARKYGEKR